MLDCLSHIVDPHISMTSYMISLSSLLASNYIIIINSHLIIHNISLSYFIIFILSIIYSQSL